MIGAIAGDIIGSIYEFDSIKTKDFPLFSEGCRFTDDTVLTVAVEDVSEDPVDCYEIVCMDGTQWDRIFLDCYHPRRSNLVPEGNKNILSFQSVRLSKSEKTCMIN